MYTSTPSPPPAWSLVDAAQLHVFTFPVRIYYEDTDAGGVVYYANYLRFCERARSEWLRALGFGQQQLLAAGGPLFVVRSVQADYLSPARLDDNLTVVSTIHDLRNVSVLFLQRIFREGKLLFTAEVKIACVSSGNGRPVPWPDAVRARFHDQLSPHPSQ
ncbi:MAG: tol-pal system-associated acyl-CoA thioesterase [Betaproteobacteria bacterium]|nr:tol-pal system-associated acyl-CoA thioesterase [Betaproteobacteria bacterium]